ncbi:aspartate aminotransferase family protein [Fictibacillus phosphorivorans]|uniref:aminotransferase family protein n=1 Tax=Fictibacillus phosphorivorans TaxID=1221500 RepID=UPI003CF46AC6
MSKTISLYQELADLDKKHFLHPTSPVQQQQQQGPAFIFTKGEGVYLEDVRGKRVIDGMSSLWNVNVGHGRKELGQAAMEQMNELAFSSCFATFSNEPAIRMAAKIAEITPGDLNATFFTSGGSEANDTAYKLARHYWILKEKPSKKKIISRKKSYHGVAMGATSATGLKPFRDFTNSLAPDFYHTENLSANSLRETIEAEGPETIAAFIAEPVQGAGGVHIAPDGYFQEIRKICSEYEILFITDEVITGFGRTGRWFGIEHYGVTPDMMCFAKGVTSGYAPLGGVVLSERIHDTFKDLSVGTLLHGYTYSGHPMACAVGLKNIEIIEKESLVENSKIMGEELLKGFKWIQEEREIVSKVRALGLIGAVELKSEKGTFAPAVVNEAAKRGLICRSVIFEGMDILVFAPPMTINKQEIDSLVEILHDSIFAIEQGV